MMVDRCQSVSHATLIGSYMTCLYIFNFLKSVYTLCLTWNQNLVMFASGLQGEGVHFGDEGRLSLPGDYFFCSTFD